MRFLRRIVAVAGLALIALAPASALTKRRLVALLSPCPGSVQLQTGLCPSTDLNFAKSSFWVKNVGYVPVMSLLSTTRAQTVPSYATRANGSLVPFPANTPRITNQGWLIEVPSTNTALHSRDMTQASWTAVNMTTSQTGTGADGVANSATILTASAGNATILQALTIGSTTETYSVYLKRVSGTGTINISENGGTSWTPCTINSTSFTRCWVEASLANPSVGIQIVTSGDSIIADFNQNEALAFPTSPIPTTTVAVTRNADVVAGTPVFLSKYVPAGFSTYFYYLLQNAVANPGAKPLGAFSDGTNNNTIKFAGQANSTVFGPVIETGGVATNPGGISAGVDNSNNKVILVAQPGTAASFAAQNGTLGTTSSPASLPASNVITNFYLGGNQADSVFFGSYIKRMTILPPISQTQAQQLTTLP